MIAGLLAVAIALSLVVVAISPQDAFGMALLVSILVIWLLLAEALLLLLGGVFLGLLFVLAARRAIALSIDARGITLGALPLRRWALLGRQRRDVRAAGADRFIPWSEVAAVHLPDTTRAWSWLWGAVLRVVIPWSMTPGLAVPWGLSVEVRQRDGTSARRTMRGVGYDAFGFAEAVRRYAPDVLVTVKRQIN